MKNGASKNESLGCRGVTRRRFGTVVWSITTLIVAMTNLFSQGPAESGVLGSNVLRISLGTPASWEILERPYEDGVGASSKNATVTSKRTFARVGEILRIIIDRPPKAPSTSWYLKGHELSMSSPESSVFLNTGETFYDPLLKTDFPELDWLLGLRSSDSDTVRGEECHVFDANPTSAERSVRRMAYVSKATGLPLYVINGDKVTEYRYLAPPPEIELPGKVLKVLQEHERLMRATFPPIPAR